MADKAYLAIDMGASSGRHVVGRFDGRLIGLEEVYRFDNGPVDVAGSLYWDLLAQWTHVTEGMHRPALAMPVASPVSASTRGGSTLDCSAAAINCSAIPTIIATPARAA